MLPCHMSYAGTVLAHLLLTLPWGLIFSMPRLLLAILMNALFGMLVVRLQCTRSAARLLLLNPEVCLTCSRQHCPNLPLRLSHVQLCTAATQFGKPSLSLFAPCLHLLSEANSNDYACIADGNNNTACVSLATHNC